MSEHAYYGKEKKCPLSLGRDQSVEQNPNGKLSKGQS